MSSLAADFRCGVWATFITALITALGLLPQAALAGEDWHSALARHWAPVIFQDVDISAANPRGRYDFIAAADFDGDIRGDNNWESADDARMADFPLKPFVYYSVVETRTHYYITYALFHPRDWQYLLAGGRDGIASLAATHENDLESATMVILKDGGYGTLRLMGTVCHLQNYCFVADPGVRPRVWAWDLSSGEIQVSFFDDRPCLFVEAGGHGIGGLRRAMKEEPGGAYPIGKNEYTFLSGTGVVYKCSENPQYVPGAEPEVVAQKYVQDITTDYQLIPILYSLWPLRHDVSGEAMFEDVFDYEVAPGCSLEELPVFFAAARQEAGANPPWAREASGDGLARGAWFLRPAEAMDAYLDEWDDRDAPGYSNYIENPYLAGDNVITVTVPERERPWIAGYPMKVLWQIEEASPPLSDAARVSVSMNRGKTWKTVSRSLDADGGEFTWEVTGPSRDECLMAVRVALQCDPGVEVAGYTSTFPVIEPETFTWSMLRDEDTGDPARSDAQAVYDRTGDRMLLFGGLSEGYHNDVWALDFESMAWAQIHDGASGAPEERCSHAAVLDTRSGRLIIHGGYGEQHFADTWAFDPETATWQRLDTTGEDRRSGCVAVYDPAGGCLVVCGGSDGDSVKNDVRSLLLETEEIVSDGHGSGTPAVWETLHSGAEPAPLARVDAAGGLDSARGRVVIHGGRRGAAGGPALKDTWAFTLADRRWEVLHDGSGYCPPARWGHTTVMDNQGRNLIVYGGTDGTAGYGDIWLFDLDLREWTQVSGGMPGTAITPRWGAAGIIRDPGGQVVIACGLDEAGLRGDAWSLELGWPADPRGEQEQAGDDTISRDLTIWPNPSRGDAHIGYTLAAAGNLKISFYDVRGRLVRIIHDAETGPGYHAFAWDGKDCAGADVGSGVYFCVLNTRGRSVERPLVVLR